MSLQILFLNPLILSGASGGTNTGTATNIYALFYACIRCIDAASIYLNKSRTDAAAQLNACRNAQRGCGPSHSHQHRHRYNGDGSCRQLPCEQPQAPNLLQGPCNKVLTYGRAYYHIS